MNKYIINNNIDSIINIDLNKWYLSLSFFILASWMLLILLLFSLNMISARKILVDFCIRKNIDNYSILNNKISYYLSLIFAFFVVFYIFLLLYRIFVILLIPFMYLYNIEGYILFGMFIEVIIGLLLFSNIIIWLDIFNKKHIQGFYPRWSILIGIFLFISFIYSIFLKLGYIEKENLLIKGLLLLNISFFTEIFTLFDIVNINSFFSFHNINVNLNSFFFYLINSFPKWNLSVDIIFLKKYNIYNKVYSASSINNILNYTKKNNYLPLSYNKELKGIVEVVEGKNDKIPEELGKIWIWKGKEVRSISNCTDNWDNEQKYYKIVKKRNWNFLKNINTWPLEINNLKDEVHQWKKAIIENKIYPSYYRFLDCYLEKEETYLPFPSNILVDTPPRKIWSDKFSVNLIRTREQANRYSFFINLNERCEKEIKIPCFIFSLKEQESLVFDEIKNLNKWISSEEIENCVIACEYEYWKKNSLKKYNIYKLEEIAEKVRELNKDYFTSKNNCSDIRYKEQLRDNRKNYNLNWKKVWIKAKEG